MKRLTVDKIRTKARAKARRRHSETLYVAVADNVYYDGYSYRVRVTKDYNRTSKNFSHIIPAIRFRNSLIQN